MSVVAKRLDGLVMEVGLGPGNFVFDGDPTPREKKAQPPPTQFLASVYCGQMIGWIKMQLGTVVNLGSGWRRCVRWGRSSPLKGA